MQLRPYQEEGLQALWNYFLSNKGNPVVAWPTGTGKSLLPAEFIRRTMLHYPGQRFLLATHVKELIKQNHDKLQILWPNAPVGIHSAGLDRRDVVQPIIYGGVQSMHRIAPAFGHRDIVFIDECHLLSPDDTTMYQKFLKVLKEINPHLKIIGMSATPYRIGQGMITDGGLFTDIAHDLTGLDDFNKLIDEGYLSMLIAPSRLETKFDISGVGVQKGDYIASQLQHEIDKAEITWKALNETVYYGQNRRSWLIYATGIEHAEHIAQMLNQLGVECAAVHSKKSDEYNEAALKAHKELKLRAIVSFSKLTTGLDHPHTDLGVIFRPTLSVALWIQMLGRMTRPVYADGYDLSTTDGRLSAISMGTKPNALILDFARNTAVLGPINDPVLPRKKGDKGGDIPVKICEACGVYHHIKAIKCIACGNPFAFKVKIVAKAGTDALVRGAEVPIIETFDVNTVFYKINKKLNKAPYILCIYVCGLTGFNEFVFPENTKWRKTFSDWWKMRHTSEPPTSTEEAYKLVHELRKPKRIRVHTNRRIDGKNWPEVLSVEY